MRIIVHIGPEPWALERIQSVLADKREQLISKGVLYPRSPGGKNHTRAFMAISGTVDTLRFNRGYALPEDQAKLRTEVAQKLQVEVDAAKPDVLILSAHQFGTVLVEEAELRALKALLLPFSDEITIMAHVEAPALMWLRHAAGQIIEGRSRSFALEAGLAGKSGTWWDKALATRPKADPQAGLYPEVQMAPAFVDLQNWTALWERVFGDGSVTLRAMDEALFASETLTDEIVEAFGLPGPIGKTDSDPRPRLPSVEWLARGVAFNDLTLRLLAKRDHILPRQLWRKFIGEMRVGGEPIDLKGFGDVAKALNESAKPLAKAHKALKESALKVPVSRAKPSVPAFTGGFRAAQYLFANLARIEMASREEQKTKAATLARLAELATPKAPEPKAPEPKTASPRPIEAKPKDIAKTPTHLPPLAQQNYEKLLSSPFAPHNKLGRVNEEDLAAAYTPIEKRKLGKNNSGNVIVGCMKNEAPYIVEWVAYHRAMGVDNFLIYTNGCEDGTSEILDRLQEMGVLQHRNNDDWKGNSPQQYALNQALKEPLIKNAEWIIHIDVDEFMNVRCGNGTLNDFFERVPEATNVAMTWRLFGHNGVTKLNDDAFVVEQFDTCAPKYCPKPHTVWGFKTMFRNIGAYEKISCHRPNKLKPGKADKVFWVNGSGEAMGKDVKEAGWRNSKKSIGYDLLQLNHYALRSAESFLIKRQRGRALHVDRSIGLNYWIRMDWSNFRDITIKRNTPRLKAEFDSLMGDDKLRHWHERGQQWHRAKADELHGIPEFQELYEQALSLELTETERVAYALALDMES